MDIDREKEKIARYLRNKETQGNLLADREGRIEKRMKEMEKKAKEFEKREKLRKKHDESVR